MSDIRKHAVQQTGRLHLLDADDEPMFADKEDGTPDHARPMVAVLYGPGSKEYARASNEQQNHNVDLLKRKGKTKESAEEARRSSAKFLAGCTAALENVEYDSLSGNDLFVAVYSDIEIGFIADQVASYLRDWGNFTKGSSKP
jgi:hypothetical protein